MIVAGGGSLGAGERLSSSRQPYLWVPDLDEVSLWGPACVPGPSHTHTCWDVADAAPDGREPRTALLVHTGVEGSHTKFLTIDDPDHAATASPGLPCVAGDKQE